MRAYERPEDGVLEGRRTFALDFHAGYRCAHAGACCSSGWAVPVEPEIEDGLRMAMAVQALRAPGGTPPARLLEPRKGLPGGARSVLRCDSRGRCGFFEAEDGRLCAIHRQLGPECLPAACRQFPRVSLLTPRGVLVTLSHYCPTAASLLFAGDTPIRIVADPAAFPADAEYEGLDARGAYPPFLRPGVLLDWDGHDIWQSHAVLTIGRQDLSLREALSLLARQAERARAWTPADGVFLEYLSEVFASDPRAAGAPPDIPVSRANRSSLWGEAVAAVANGVAPPQYPDGCDELFARLVSPALAGQAAPVRRYLAARAFASWLGLQGQGLRTVVRGLDVTLAVLEVECARACGAARRRLDGALLKEAIRASDLLLVHLVSPGEFARRLSAVED